MEWLQNHDPIELLKNAALVLFFGIFSGVVLWLLMRKNSEIRRWSRIPLEDDPTSVDEVNDEPADESNREE